MSEFIESTTGPDKVMDKAREYADEFGLNAPDTPTGQLLTTLAALAVPGSKSGAVVASPALAVTGAYVARGVGDDSKITCIEPEVEHRTAAQAIFTGLGIAESTVRFMPSRPLDVMGRLADASYGMVVGDVAPADLPAFMDAAWKLVAPGGIMVLMSSLLDGTIGDDSRTDRSTLGARRADEKIRELDDASITRLPLGGGVTIAVKHAPAR
ncbi:O-methyltransferase [Corynebacterium sp. CCM 8862]|uniref:O-methyltransferase n=2 Tax=Corynebacterium mendelii TaxID=2765362 RepID=A0A939IW34_9CORY|nr:O-methyltransferase [Corynebacterium mendelii]MBN9644871.1 O-methyltransferase [Corynebacterium mendelii]